MSCWCRRRSALRNSLLYTWHMNVYLVPGIHMYFVQWFCPQITNTASLLNLNLLLGSAQQCVSVTWSGRCTDLDISRIQIQTTIQTELKWSSWTFKNYRWLIWGCWIDFLHIKFEKSTLWGIVGFEIPPQKTPDLTVTVLRFWPENEKFSPNYRLETIILTPPKLAKRNQNTSK